jgi:hypothetical protein
LFAAWKAVASAATRRGPEPQPKPRRRRREESGAAFRAAAKKILRRTVRLPAAAFTAAAFLSDTLDWLNLWHGNEAAGGDELADDCHDAGPNHLSPHL